MKLNDTLDLATRTGVPLLIWGPPGVGKSASIRKWAADRRLRCWTVIASLREPADFAGLPVVLGSEPLAAGERQVPTVGFAPPRFAVEAALHGGVIFLDELTTAPPAVQAALLRAVVEKAFGDLELDPAKVTLVAAANPPSEAAGGWDLAAPLANRFCHHTYPLVAEEWVEAFPSYWGSAPALAFAGERLEEGEWARARSLVAAFVRARPNLLLQMPEESSRRGEAWPSPRTWDYLSRLLAGARQGGGSASEALPLLAGSVGEGPALEFLTWLTELDLPDPEELLARPESYRHPQRGDHAYAVLSAVCQAAVGRLTEQRWTSAWKVLARAAEEGGADVAASAARTLARARRRDLPLPHKEMVAFFPLLQAASLIGSVEQGNGHGG